MSLRLTILRVEVREGAKWLETGCAFLHLLTRRTDGHRIANHNDLEVNCVLNDEERLWRQSNTNRSSRLLR